MMVSKLLLVALLFIFAATSVVFARDHKREDRAAETNTKAEGIIKKPEANLSLLVVPKDMLAIPLPNVRPELNGVSDGKLLARAATDVSNNERGARIRS